MHASVTSYLKAAESEKNLEVKFFYVDCPTLLWPFVFHWQLTLGLPQICEHVLRQFHPQSTKFSIQVYNYNLP